MGMSSGLIVAGISGATAVGISFAAIPFLAPAMRRVCIPFVPATPVQLKNVSRALAECTPKRGPLIDLGSGDGRVVMQCASEGIASTGVELNGILVAYSKYRAARAGLSSKARFRRIDIFKTDLERFNTALIFGAENMMGDLLPKLSEMRSGASLLCCRFPLPECDHFKPIAQIGDGIDAVYVYKRT